jgi:putative FmdB family regulatory protein
MPTYDYHCPQCGGFDALRRLAERDEPAACPQCGVASARVVGFAPQLGLLAEDTRRALQRNERAAHEPASSRDYARLRHPAGCGCCRTGAPPASGAAARAAPDGAKAFPNRRPWMISH